MISTKARLWSMLFRPPSAAEASCIVIDAAHSCQPMDMISDLDYKLWEVRQQFPPVIAFDCDGHRNVKVDAIHNLGIKGCETLTQSSIAPI